MNKYPAYATPKTFKYPEFAVILALHLIALAAPFTFTWSGLTVFIVLALLTGGIGVTLSYHRLLTHRSFKAHPIVSFTSTYLACLALQGGPVSWVGTHRHHHKYSDQPEDAHTPMTGGFWWAHLWWNFFRHPDLDTPEKLRRLTPDLHAEPMMMFFEKHFFGLFLLTAVVLCGIAYYIGGPSLAISWFVWGFALRTVYSWHTTWLVNSATHVWGYQNYHLKDDSRNLWWVALLTYGEGWHNNHHSDPRSASHGHLWFEFDISYQIIRVLAWAGLAKDVVLPRIQRQRQLRKIALHPGTTRQVSAG